MGQLFTFDESFFAEYFDDLRHKCAHELASGTHGGFAKALAEAWFVADSHNRKLIEQNWGHLWEKVLPLVS